MQVQPSNPHLFVSGSRDNTIRVWDRRQDRSVGMFVTVDAAGTDGVFNVAAHADRMVTSLDVADNTLISTGVDTIMSYLPI